MIVNERSNVNRLLFTFVISALFLGLLQTPSVTSFSRVRVDNAGGRIIDAISSGYGTSRTAELAMRGTGSMSPLPPAVISRLAAVGIVGSAAPACPSLPHCAPTNSENQFREFFTYILGIPVPVLEQGDDALKNWVRQHPRRGSTGDANLTSFQTRNWTFCVLGVAALLAQVFVPAAIVLDIVRAIRAAYVATRDIDAAAITARLVVGSVSDIAQGKVRRMTAQQLVEKIGKALAGIAGVDECFD